MNNLKNIGLAMRVFATDHHNKYPMQLPASEGGTREHLTDPANIWMHFAALSNELTAPKILLCPFDKSGRIEATTFDRSLRGKSHRPFSQNANLSYFLGLDAAVTNPMSLLAGDRNLLSASHGLAYGTARVVDLGTNHSLRHFEPGIGWDEKVHKGSGNVLMGDGSVQQLITLRLREALRNSGEPRNRIAVPD